MIDTKEFQVALFRVAFCAMACDGHVADSEIEELEEMDTSTPYFQSVDLSSELEEMLARFNEPGCTVFQDLFKWLEDTSLTPVRELLVLEVALRIANSDGRHDENEIRFVNLLRSKLELHDEDLLSRFGADTMLCINESSGIAKSAFTPVNELRLGLKATELLNPKSQE